MRDHDLSLDIGTLCRCCDFHSYKLPVAETFRASDHAVIKDLCKLCVDNFQLTAVNA